MLGAGSYGIPRGQELLCNDKTTGKDECYMRILVIFVLIVNYGNCVFFSTHQCMASMREVTPNFL